MGYHVGLCGILFLGFLGLGSCEGDNNPCLLPPDSGSCNTTGSTPITGNGKGFEKRYFYSTTNYKCAEFPFSGCGGNGNNFKSVEECVRTCNESRGDTDQIKSAMASNKCWYKNKLYSIRDAINETIDDNPCSVGCYCTEFMNGQARISCAAIDCAPPPNRQDCVPLYANNTCCPTHYSCDQNDEDTTGKNEKPVFKCKYGQEEYLEGQTIYPEDYPCFKCTCNRNFTGAINTESCQEVNCGISIHNQLQLANRCQPEYYVTEQGQTLCCPINWKCADQEERKMEQNRNNQSSST